MSAGSSSYAGGSPRLSNFGSPPQGSPLQGSPLQGSPPQTRLEPAEVRCYLEEGLEGVERHQYYNAKRFGTAINKRIREFQSCGPAQYAVFSPVTDKEFTEIDKIRNRHHKGLRFLFLANERTLVVKFVVGIAHEIAHRGFAETFIIKVYSMGLRRNLMNVGRAIFSGLAGQKEADTGFKPMSREFITD